MSLCSKLKAKSLASDSYIAPLIQGRNLTSHASSYCTVTVVSKWIEMCPELPCVQDSVTRNSSVIIHWPRQENVVARDNTSKSLKFLLLLPVRLFGVLTCFFRYTWTIPICDSRGRELLKFTSGQIQDGVRPHNFQSLNHCNSAEGCSISLKFVTEFYHVTIHCGRSMSKGQRSRSQHDVTCQRYHQQVGPLSQAIRAAKI